MIAWNSCVVLWKFVLLFVERYYFLFLPVFFDTNAQTRVQRRISWNFLKSEKNKWQIKIHVFLFSFRKKTSLSTIFPADFFLFQETRWRNEWLRLSLSGHVFALERIANLRNHLRERESGSLSLSSSARFCILLHCNISSGVRRCAKRSPRREKIEAKIEFLARDRRLGDILTPYPWRTDRSESAVTLLSSRRRRTAIPTTIRAHANKCTVLLHGF